MKYITEFRFGDVSIDFSEDDRVVVQDDDVKFDVETETFKQICIQYLCLECPDVIKFDGEQETKTYRYEKVTFEKASDAVIAFENGDELHTHFITQGFVSVEAIQQVVPNWQVNKLYRRIEVMEEELELEAAYDLYCHVYDNDISFDSFCDFRPLKNAYIKIVRKTGYRKSLNDVNGKG